LLWRLVVVILYHSHYPKNPFQFFLFNYKKLKYLKIIISKLMNDE
jgi:hypothetical protein